MSKQEERSITLYDGKAFGVEVSDYALENGYLDYRTLARIIEDCIFNNQLIEETGWHDWDVMTGENLDDEIYQYYIISRSGYEFLSRYTDEIVLYNEKLDIYLWAITHFGTSWDYVLTDIKLRVHLQND